MAAATDETDTRVMFRNGDAGWNGAYAPVRLASSDKPASGAVAAISACLAFPDDFHGIERPVLYAGIAGGTGDGDVYRIDPLAGNTATDLNAGSPAGLNDLPVSGLAVQGNNNNLTLIAGAADSSLLVSSRDGGLTWGSALRTPPGDGITVLAYDGATAGFHGATSGANGGFAISLDAGETWNQVSFINDAIYAVIEFAVSPRYETDGTIFMITFGNGRSLWRTADGAVSWERLLQTPEEIKLIGLPPEYGADSMAVFLAGCYGGSPAVWSSRDGGQTFRIRPTCDPSTGMAFPIDAWQIVDSVTLVIGSGNYGNAAVFTTTNCGFFYSAGIRLGNKDVTSLALSPDYAHDYGIVAADKDGWVYYSQNGEDFIKLPSDASLPPFRGNIRVAFDPLFKENGIIYAVSDVSDGGIWRFRSGKSQEWVAIDASLPAGSLMFDIVVTGDGVLYAVNNTTGLGLERCLNPSAGDEMIWDTVNRGLPENAELGLLEQTGDILWSVDMPGNRLMVFHDTLTRPLDLHTPENGAAGLGSVADSKINDIRLKWDTSSGAIKYEWQCSIDPEYSYVLSSLEDETSAGYVLLTDLAPATTYYWRVRAIQPARSPWSKVRSFTTCMVPGTPVLLPGAPAVGAQDISLSPVFQWKAVLGATGYELLVDTTVEFNNPVIDRTGNAALQVNFWECDVMLNPATTYYWKFRALGDNTFSEWSAVGAFKTAPLPPGHEVTSTEAVNAQNEANALTVATGTSPVVPVPTFTIMVTNTIAGIPGTEWLVPAFSGLAGVIVLLVLLILILTIKVWKR